MHFFNKKIDIKSVSSRWLWLTAGLIAIIVLSGLNLYSLYQLRNHSVKTIQKSKILQVAEFADRTRHRFIHPFHGFSSLSMNKIEKSYTQDGKFTDKFLKIIYRASNDSIFTDIYYVPKHSNICYQTDEPFLQFNKKKKAFVPASNPGTVICDGLGIARTRMRAIINGYEFNNKILFDTHRSFTIALVNLDAQAVVGYLVMPINQSYLINKYIQPELVKYFGGEKEAGITVWLRYWTKQKVLASSDPEITYNPDHIQYIHQFPDLFDDWRLYVAMDESILAASQSSSFVINLIVLGVAFIFLLGALVFMFVTAQRERSLAERQSAFLANVTHELKTPLSVIQAAGENLSDGRIQNEYRVEKYGSHIYTEALRLRQMIEKLLNVAKTDAGKYTVNQEPCFVDQLVKNYFDKHRHFIVEHGVELNVHTENNMPQAMLDEHSFYTILSNLVQNAFKYSLENKYLRVSLTSDRENIILEVEDHGVGMDSKTMEHLFEKFYRAQNSLTTKANGYGLGLSIVKNLVKLNNGTIHVESEKNKGTTFTVKFPVIKNDQIKEKVENNRYEYTK